MSGWSEGYVADVDYTAGYFTELNPLHARLAVLNAGWAFPKVRHAFEMAFGHGVTVNIHAAGSPARWHGNDFTPAQAANARDMAEAAGSQAQLSDESFAELLERQDLPLFDFIALHGIWSWVSPANRQLIVAFIRRQLAPGGVVYLSYNTLPGWSHAAPMRQLIRQHALAMHGAAEGTVARVQNALGFAQSFLGAAEAFGKAYPLAQTWLDQLKQQDPIYVGHEYFNEHWTPMYFGQVAEELEPAKLGFAASAALLEHIHPLNLTAAETALLGGIDDRQQREALRDFVVNQQFRRDYWVKGLRRLSPIEQAERLRALRFVLVTPVSAVPLKVRGRLGEAKLTPAIYQPVLARLADHHPLGLGELEAGLQSQGLDLPKILQAVMVLAHEGHLAPAQDDAEIAAARGNAQRLNRHILRQALSLRPLTHLCSPVTGGGVSIPWHHQLCLLARAEAGASTPEDWVDFAWQAGASTRPRELGMDRPPESEAAWRTELLRRARLLAETGIPVLEALQVL